MSLVTQLIVKLIQEKLKFTNQTRAIKGNYFPCDLEQLWKRRRLWHEPSPVSFHKLQTCRETWSSVVLRQYHYFTNDFQCFAADGGLPSTIWELFSETRLRDGRQTIFFDVKRIWQCQMEHPKRMFSANCFLTLIVNKLFLKPRDMTRAPSYYVKTTEKPFAVHKNLPEHTI